MRIFPILICACALLLPACFAASPEKTDPALSSDSASESDQAAANADAIEIPIGSPMARVLKALGPADATDYPDGKREIWRYTHKRAEYAYTAKTGGAATLVIGKYIVAPQPESPGQRLLLTIVFDAAKNVADFNFALMAY